jgi:hypothetical protein
MATVVASHRGRRLNMNPLTWLAIAVILLIIFVAVTLDRIRRARPSGVAPKEVQPKKDRVSGEDD